MKSVHKWSHDTVLTTAFLVTVVVAVIIPVTHLAERQAVPVVTTEVSRWAGGRWSPAQVIQLVRFIPAVIVPVTEEIPRDAAPVLTGELVLLAWLIGAALFITAVSTIITTVTPSRHTKSTAGIYERNCCLLLEPVFIGTKTMFTLSKPGKNIVNLL